MLLCFELSENLCQPCGASHCMTFCVNWWQAAKAWRRLSTHEDPRVGHWLGPRESLTWGRGYACVSTDEGPWWIPARCVRPELSVPDRGSAAVASQPNNYCVASLLNQSFFGVPFLETDLQTLLQKSECMWGMKNLTESLGIWDNWLPLYNVNPKEVDIVCNLNVDSCLT